MPKSTPAVIIEMLKKEINAGLADPKIKARLADLGGTPFVATPAELGNFGADEIEKWAKVMRDWDPVSQKKVREALIVLAAPTQPFELRTR